MELTGKQKRHLRSLGHNLSVVVTVGKEGITGALIGAIDQVLLDHELIKVRIGQNAVMESKAAAQDLATKSDSNVAQVIGSTVLLYRPHPKEPTIKLPAPSKGPPRK